MTYRYAKGESVWARLPSKPQLDSQRQLIRDETGKPKYSNFLRWRSRDIDDRFSAAVINLIREAGHALNGEGQP